MVELSVTSQVQQVLDNVLKLSLECSFFDMDNPLLGAIPEFDSMVVVNLIMALEDRFGFAVDDDEIDASVFETVASLVAFVEAKLQVD